MHGGGGEGEGGGGEGDGGGGEGGGGKGGGGDRGRNIAYLATVELAKSMAEAMAANSPSSTAAKKDEPSGRI